MPSSKPKKGINDLATKNPGVAAEWHPLKNGILTPNDVTYGSTKRVWWQCLKFSDHIWEATINDRTNHKTGCPYCFQQSSRPELRILAEFRTLFSEVCSRQKISELEIDIYLPEIKVGVEYDGFYYHRNKEKQDAKKNQTLLDEYGITLIRVREKPLTRLSDLDVLVSQDELLKSDLNLIINQIIESRKLINNSLSATLQKYVNAETFTNEIKFFEYLSCLPGPIREESLGFKDSKIAEEWHPVKNGTLTPNDVSIGSSLKVWWQCSEKSTHEWQAKINDRTGQKRSKCPYCSGKLASPGNCLLDVFPEIAKQWHPIKNGEIKTCDITPKSGQKFWWKCSKFSHHEWEARVSDRTIKEQGCPFCAGKRAFVENSLKSTFPAIAEEWHPIKNGTLSPDDVTRGSSKKVWWQCLKFSDHIWEATINDRTNGGTGCPYCSGNRVSVENSLASKFPDIAKQWHPIKNDSLKPEAVTFSSNQKVWWQCLKFSHHEWETTINSRTNGGTGCPYCSGNRVSVENSLQTKFPNIAKEWHQTKNGLQTPSDFTYGSKKKVWWQCLKFTEHEWEARINNRTSGQGCPLCSGKRK